MFSSLVFASTVALASSQAPITLDIEGRDLALTDLVSSSTLPRELEDDFILLTAPDGVEKIELPVEAQERLLRQRLPTYRLDLKQQRTLQISFSPSASRQQVTCYALKQPVDAGGYLHAALAEVVACDATREVAEIRMSSAASAPQAVTALPQGAYLGEISLPRSFTHAAGSEMTLTTRTGPVTITRSAVLMQPGRPGRQVFIRLSDNRIIAARLGPDGESK